MSNEPEIEWPGASGAKYKYWIYPVTTMFTAGPGNYIFAKETRPGSFEPIYIGETGDLSERFDNHHAMPCIRGAGSTHIHVHASAAHGQSRRNEETDLRGRWATTCNKQG